MKGICHKSLDEAAHHRRQIDPGSAGKNVYITQVNVHMLEKVRKGQIKG